MQVWVPGFRCRAALRETVTNAALRYLSQNGGGSVVIFAVMGGYEARTPERGVPRGSHMQLEIVTAPPAEPPVPPAVPPVTNESESAQASVAPPPATPIAPGKPAMKRGKMAKDDA